MRKNKLLLLLALLLTATTGAWAQDAKHLITATYDKQTRLLEQPLPYETTVGALYEAVTGQSISDLISDMTASGMPLTGISSGDPSVVSIGELNGASTPVTVKADGKATVGISFSGIYQYIYVSVVPPLYVTMADGTKDAAKWTATVGTNSNAQPLPVGELNEKDAVTLTYTGRLKVKNVTATTDTKPVWDGDLSKLTAESTAEFATATDGMTITGTLAANVKVSIAAGATVTLDGVTINGVSNEDYKWAGLNCLGNATIVLKDGTTNTVTGFSEVYPGIHVPKDKTLTIQGGTEGNGKLTASSNGFGAGIGGGYSIACGDISIEGGIITAGGQTAAGIGSGFGAICGNITISGGTVTATGGYKAAGIGGGPEGTCGAITIANTVTKVTATKDQDAPYSIGAGGYSGGNLATCGTVTIGGTKYWENNAAVDNDADNYLKQATIVYPKLPATVTTAPTGAAIVGVGKSTALVSGGVADGGTLMYAVTTTNTKPTSTAGFSDAVPTAKDITASGKVYVWYYVKADDTHSDSEIAATAIEVPVADIVWDVTNVTDIGVFEGDPYEKEGVTLSANAQDIFAWWDGGIIFSANGSGGYTFTAPDEKAFTKIEMKPVGPDEWNEAYLGTGWAFNNSTVTWTGSAASTVELLTGADSFAGESVKSIAFYLSE